MCRIRAAQFALCATLVSVPLHVGWSQSHSYRGLWVGQATLNAVNEVTVPLDEDNVAIAPDPEVPTTTADEAHLRLILHVNGSGQVSLLKEVAVLARDDLTNVLLGAESDMALVTDEALYGAFPPQPAVRVASATFDFGDSRATEALNTILKAAAAAAARSVDAATANVYNRTGRITVLDDAEQAALAAAQPLIATADVAAAFSSFLADDLPSATVNDIAVDLADAADPEDAAEALAGNFYRDARASELVASITGAVGRAKDAGGTPEDVEAAAHTAASAGADVTDNYNRFIGGRLFGDMIVSAARSAAKAAKSGSDIADAVDNDVTVNDARERALQLKVAQYTDARFGDAIETVLDAIIATAGVVRAQSPLLVEEAVSDRAERAGRNALADDVPRYRLSPLTPTLDYNNFVRSDAFLDSAADAAQAAAAGAVSERRNNRLYTSQSLEDAAQIAAYDALRGAYGKAALAKRHFLPLDGAFGPGEGDPRTMREVKDPAGGGPLGPAGVEGSIYLPASFATNPFRHRRHPDHTIGLDILRHIRLDFASPSNSVERVGYGVERIAGTYREEIIGLHKELGPDKDVGLRVEGTFELNRISRIDTLNAFE